MESKYEHLRQQLLEERADIQQRVQANDRMQLEQSMRDSDGELSMYDNHPGDAASTMYEREKDISLLEHERQQLEEIEKAILRMDEGKYGKCLRCGKEIPMERLEAIPTAEFCIDHQKTPVYTSDRPVEEDVLTGYEQFDFDDRDDETEFDAEDSWQAVARFNELPNVYELEYESEEARGYVEPVEGFIITDLDGNVVEDSIDILRNHAYFEYLDHGEGEGMIWEE